MGMDGGEMSELEDVQTLVETIDIVFVQHHAALLARYLQQHTAFTPEQRCALKMLHAEIGKALGA